MGLFGKKKKAPVLSKPAKQAYTPTTPDEQFQYAKSMPQNSPKILPKTGLSLTSGMKKPLCRDM